MNEFERDYIGKQNGLAILFPSMIDRSELIKRFIYILDRMDDKTFESFIDVFANYLTKNNIDHNYSKEEISIFFNQLKNENKDNLHPPTIYTCFSYEPYYCLKEWIIALIRFIILLPIYLIACLITTEPTIN